MADPMLTSVQTSSTTSTATPSPHPFEKRVDEVNVSKNDLNSIIMDYLVTEGYPEAAERFATEANLSPRVDLDSISQRVEIRTLIYEGDIKTAIEKINDLNPQLLDQDASLHFYLLRLQLIELIRGCMHDAGADGIVPPVEFAMAHLSPRAAGDEQLLHDLEMTMCLSIFRADQLTPPLQALLDPQMRRDMAKRVNEAILESTGERTKAKLFDLVKLRAWSEQKAREAKKDLPDQIDIGLDSTSYARGEHTAGHSGYSHGNGNSETMVS